MLAVAVLLVAVVVAFGIARSQDGSESADIVSPDTSRDLVATGAALIDVRTPEEYADGHLEGASNIPVESDDFDAQVDPLDRAATYVIYCKTGRRAGIAIERMHDLGFTDLHNAGGIDDLADVVAPVVT